MSETLFGITYIRPSKRKAKAWNGWGDYDRLLDLWYRILVRAKEIAESVPNATWWECS